MIPVGTILKFDSGRRIRVNGFIKSGGQGDAYLTTEVGSGQKGVVKVFHECFANDQTIRRLRFLVVQDLSLASPVLCAPIDVLNRGTLVGHYTAFADGIPLEELLTNPNCTLDEQIQLAIALAHAMVILHSRQIAHGDLHAENLIIKRVGDVFHLQVIDFDNFNAPGLAAPPCVGHNLYMAPELREALEQHRLAVPTINTDRFALGVLMHEIMLLRHPSAGADDNEEAFLNVMRGEKWVHDPAAPDRPKGDLGGYPTEVLNTNLARLFRSVWDRDPMRRPTPDVWEAELVRAFDSIYCCPKCGGPFIVDVSKTSCPLCKAAFPYLTMRLASDRRALPLDNGALVIGRAQLGGSMKISARHSTFRRIGPETWVESHGSNGTCRWNGTSWIRLPDNRPVLVQAGDRLRLGDAEVRLE